MPSNYSDWQYQIYEAGTKGESPPWPVNEPELQARAQQVMSPEAWAYVAGNAASGATTRANAEAFQKVFLVPRVLQDPSKRTHSTTILGSRLPVPIMLAPIGVMKLIHPQGEVGAARAAATLGLGFVHSTASTTTMEEIAAAAPNTPRWYQMYIPKDRQLALSFIHRAEQCRYQAIVITLDTTTRAWRPLDLNLGHLPFLHGNGIANYLADPVFRAALAVPPEKDMAAAIRHWRTVSADPSIDWETIRWVRSQTELPLILKGILHPEDARKAMEAGVNGIVVSNHGGRQLDGAIASLEALPAIVAAVQQKMTILFDSGIRCGADVVKALALGAEAVFLGRPWVWGLAVGGEEGVVHALKCFLADYDVTLGLLGHKSPAGLSRDDLRVSFIS